jgi:hypothetical protein
VTKLVPADVRAYLARDWQAVRDAKHAYWQARLATGGADAALAASDQLRIFCQGLNPGWPSDQDREADLEAHRRVAQALRRVPATPPPTRRAAATPPTRSARPGAGRVRRRRAA